LRAGIGYSLKGNIASASSAFDKAQALFTALGNTEGVAEVFLQRGILFRGVGRFDEADAQFQKTLETARATGNESQQINALMGLSYLSYIQGLTAKAQTYAQRAVDFALEKHLENLATGGLLELGNSYVARGDYPQGEGYFKQALEFAQANKGRRREATALLNLGGLYIQQLRTDEGLKLVEQAYSFYQQGNYPREMALCLINIARANRRKGDYEAALKALQQKLEIAQQTGEQPQIAVTYAEIGSVLIEEERYTEALVQYDRSYDINKSLNNLIAIAYNQHNRGNILWHLGRNQQARDALGEALQIASQPDNAYKPLVPDIQLSYAQVFLCERKYPEAIRQSEAAMKLAGDQYKSVAIAARYTLGLAKALSGSGPAGLALCEEATKEARGLADVGLLSRSLLAQAQAALESGAAPLALKLAIEAQERFARSGQQESEWRAWLIAARASDRLGDVPASREQFAKAKEVLLRLEQKWEPDAYKQYLNRADIQMYRNQLG
jgi:tetratricopeptide (TPR) repeat protein